MSRYAIWNKKDNIITPSGKVFTAEQWIQQNPVAALDDITIVCSSGVINGGFFGVLEAMVHDYENVGLDFSKCKSVEDKLELIENFHIEQEQEAASRTSNEELTATSLASIAASLEYQNMLTLDDVEEV